MIQRKQSLYLFIVAILCALPLILPLAEISMSTPVDATTVVNTNDGAVYDVWGIHYMNGGGETFYYHGILAVLAVLLPVVNIFLYNRRELQLRLCVVQGIFILGLIGFMAIGLYRINEMFVNSPYIVDRSLFATAPIVALAFLVLAYKGIAKDIWLLKSADRIR